MKFNLAFFVPLLLAGTGRAQIVIDHQPYPLGGGGSDTEYLANGQPSWTLSADDFSVSEPAAIKQVIWWGYYRTPAPADETIRIRFYAARPGDALPGSVLFEQLVFDSVRAATGRFVADQGQPPEYRYATTLQNPMLLNASTHYWIEITQIGDLASTFVHELSLADRSPYAFMNSTTVDWRRTFDQVDLAFQLIVPEPATAALMAIGAVALRTARRRRTPTPIER